MKALDSKKRASLIRVLVLNVFVSTLLLALIFGYVSPTYTALSAKIADINSLNRDYLRKMADGFTVDEYFSLASKYAKISFSQEDKKNKQDFEEVLKKRDPSVTYEEWLKKELTKKGEFDAEVERNDSIIAGIIPTYSELSIDNSLFERNRITLSDLVTFVENDLLKKHSLTSYSNIGFTNLSFEKAQSSTVNIGTYRVNLEVTGTNKNILDFITTVQSSGKLTIEEGKLTGPNFTPGNPFSNLLITIDQLAFAQPIERMEKENKVAATLIFYVRAKSYSDLLKIRTSLADSSKKLYEDIKKASELCTNMSADYCKNDAALKAIQAVRALVGEAKALDTLLQSSVKATSTQDVTGEFDKLASSTASFTTLQANFAKYKSIIDDAQKARTN